MNSLTARASLAIRRTIDSAAKGNCEIC